MKSSKISLILICLFAVSQISFGQEISKASKIDEFNNVTCQDLWSRLDSFLNDLNEDSGAQGYVVINGKKNDLRRGFRYESWTDGIISNRNFNRDRIEIIRGNFAESLVIQFWKVPAGAEKPNFAETKWIEKRPKFTKPYIFTAYSYEDGLCPSTSPTKRFAAFLIANPNARGHLVLRDKSNKKFQQIEKGVLAELVNQYKVPRNRLRLFYIKDKNYTYGFTDVEFWLVPQKKK